VNRSGAPERRAGPTPAENHIQAERRFWAPPDQAELVAAEVEQLALEIDAPGPLALAVVRRPFRPGWTVLELAIVDGEPLRR
jgi:hypothetical protein